MIKANELRIGNIVEYKIHGKDEWVSAPIFSIHFEKDYSKNFRPIPLTPEILEQCGFELIKGMFSRDKDYYAIIKGEIIDSFNKEMQWDKENNQLAHPYKHIKHLHQLQNLIFALTGEELQINLSVTHTS